MNQTFSETKNLVKISKWFIRPRENSFFNERRNWISWLAAWLHFFSHCLCVWQSGINVEWQRVVVVLVRASSWLFSIFFIANASVLPCLLPFLSTSILFILLNYFSVILCLHFFFCHVLNLYFILPVYSSSLLNLSFSILTLFFSFSVLMSTFISSLNVCPSVSLFVVPFKNTKTLEMCLFRWSLSQTLLKSPTTVVQIKIQRTYLWLLEGY